MTHKQDWGFTGYTRCDISIFVNVEATWTHSGPEFEPPQVHHKDTEEEG